MLDGPISSRDELNSANFGRAIEMVKGLGNTKGSIESEECKLMTRDALRKHAEIIGAFETGDYRSKKNQASCEGQAKICQLDTLDHPKSGIIFKKGVDGTNCPDNITHIRVDRQKDELETSNK
jgi:hypothetical protein